MSFKKKTGWNMNDEILIQADLIGGKLLVFEVLKYFDLKIYDDDVSLVNNNNCRISVSIDFSFWP